MTSVADNLYLDLNGVIHNCTHGDPGADEDEISEAEMFRRICSYIEVGGGLDHAACGPGTCTSHTPHTIRRAARKSIWLAHRVG